MTGTTGGFLNVPYTTMLPPAHFLGKDGKFTALPQKTGLGEQCWLHPNAHVP